MITVQHDKKQNYYTSVNNVKVYVDHINKRLKIQDYNNIAENTIFDIIEFARNERLGKIITNCLIGLLNPFRLCDFQIEGIINGFFHGADAYCISYFIDPQRSLSSRKAEEEFILSQCMEDSKKFTPVAKTGYEIRNAVVSDIPEMISLFAAIFESYPSPILSPEYLQKVMYENVIFKVALDAGKIISIASADMDKRNMNAEITDCATYPEYRGKGILPNLIYNLEADLKEKSYLTAYSLSRAVNPGINKSLKRLEYKYCGRLVNNCHICGNYEDMNIWVKNLNA